MENQGENVKRWVAEAKERGSTGFVDVCDTFDYEHYPIFFGGPLDTHKTGEDIVFEKCGKNMQVSYGIFEAG